MGKVILTNILLASMLAVGTAMGMGQVAPSPQAATASVGRLPVKRVVLYKSGIGYFEHSARVRGSQELNIDFTTAQLNDVLKSLTAVDLGEGRITGVRYNSIAPLGERLKTLRLPLAESTTREDFLNALRGARVEVRSGATVALGRIMAVEKKPNWKPDGTILTESSELVIVTDAGEMRSFELGPSTAVRIVERDLGEEVGRYLDLVGSARAKDLRRMTISATGTGEREIFVSYISEVPVWKSTYRILLPSKPDSKPLLQGWAIVDNTVGEDWEDVQLTLVAGAPQSFIQQISQPYYARRPVVALPEALTLTPQTHEGTMALATGPGFAGGVGMGIGGGFPPGSGGLEGTVKDPSGAVVPGVKVTVRNEETGAAQTTVTNSNGYYRFNNVPAGNSALIADAPGFRKFILSNIYLGVGRMNEIHPTLEVGAATQAVEVRAAAPSLQTATATLSRVVESAQPEAEARGAGDFFQYEIKQNVTIGKNQSALVPILQSRIDAEKVTLWGNDSPQPLRALWITNTSGLTLDGGAFNVLEEETFAGEGLLDAVRPNEKRLISYAADPAVRITEEEDSAEKPVSRVRIAKGLMTMTREQRETKTYTIRNSDSTPRQVIIEHPARAGWKLVGALKPEESSVSSHRFRVKVEPGKTERLVVEEYMPEEAQVALTDLTSDHVTLLAEQKRVTPAMEQAFQRILAQKSEISSLDAQLHARQAEIQAITEDQERLRENLKSLKGSAEEKALMRRYIQQLDEQENRLTALRAQVSELRDKREKASQELDRMLLELTLDETF